MSDLALRVQESRRALIALLRPSERRTRRAPGFAYSPTFEDHARAVESRGGKRAREVGEALAAYQAALNDLWRFALESGAIVVAAEHWIKKRGIAWTRRDDVRREATWLAREELGRWRAGSSLETYLTVALARSLDKWDRLERLPVYVPENVRA